MCRSGAPHRGARGRGRGRQSLTKKIEIYTTPWCPFCIAAKKLLNKKGVQFEEIDVMHHPDLRHAMAARAGGARTVPQIFADGEHIGDCNRIMELETDDELDAKLGLG